MSEAHIVHVVPYYPPHLGGMEKVVSIIAEELAKTTQVEVLTTDCAAEGAVRLERRGRLTIRRLRAFEVVNLPVAPSLFWECLKISRRSIVHVHVAQALIPEIVWVARCLRRGKYIAHFHLDVAPSGRFGRIFSWYKKRIIGHTLRAAVKVIALTADQAKFLEQAYRVDVDKIAVVPNGIGLEFSPRPESGTLRDGPLRVLYVGR